MTYPERIPLSRAALFLTLLPASLNGNGAVAAGHHVQLVGIPDRASFADESKTIWEALKKKNYSGTLIIGSNGRGAPLGNWNYAQKQSVNATRSGSALDALRTEASKVEPGNHLVMYVADHGVSKNGWAGDGGPGKPSNTGMVMAPQHGTFVSWPEVVSATKEKLPKGSSLKIIAGPCFSGGVHAAVAKTANACAISSSDYLSVGYSAGSRLDTNFDEAVGDQLTKNPFDPDKSGKSSLMEAYFYSLEKDFDLSGARSAISSFDFVDSILKEGPYHKARVKLDSWRSEVGNEIKTCANAPFGVAMIKAPFVQDISKILDKYEESEAKGDWNDIPKELRNIFQAATEERGFKDSVFGPRDLKDLRNANSRLNKKTRVAELATIRKDWAKRDDPNSSPAVKEFHHVLENLGGRQLQTLDSQALENENRLRTLNRDYHGAVSGLQSAIFFVKNEIARVDETNQKRLGKLREQRKVEAERKSILEKTPGLRERLATAENGRNQHLAELQGKLRERHEKLTGPSDLDMKEARVAVLREKMVRVARFMKAANPSQKAKYLSLLKCELEDL